MNKRADDLRALRLQKRLTQEEVAAKFKVSQGYYSAVERGRKPGEVAAAAASRQSDANANRSDRRRRAKGWKAEVAVDPASAAGA